MALFDVIQGFLGRPDPTQQLAASLGQGPGQPGSPQGPQPLAGPNASPGGPAGPGGSPDPSGGPAAPQAPPQPAVYQSPPDLAQMYLALQQRDQARQQFNSGLGLLAASMYPGRHPEMIMKAMSGQQGEDAGSTFNALYQIHNMQLQQQSLDAFRRSIPDIATKLGMTQDQVLALGPQGASEVLAKIAETNAGVTGGPAWIAQQRAEKALTDAGQPIPWTPHDPVSYNAYNLSKAQADETHAKNLQEFKDSGVEDFSAVDQKLTKNESTVASLLKNMPATMSALQAPDFLTTGKLPGWLPGGGPYDQSVKNAANSVNTLKAELAGEGLRNVKNVRNVREFNTLASALTNALDPSNSQEQVQAALESIQKGFATAHAQAYAVAGKEVPYSYKGLADQRYLTRGGPYDTGATQEDAPADSGGGGGGTLKPMPDTTKSAAQALIAKDPSQRGPLIEHLRQQGIDPSGL